MSTTYRQIKSEVRARLMAGEWGPGDTLPTESELASSYDCARVTVNRALRELAEEGYLERRRKSGTRVRAVPERSARFEIPLVRQEVEALGRSYAYALLTRQEGPPTDDLAARMGLADDARILHLTCLHRADGVPFLYEDRWINLATLPQAQAADFSLTGPNEWLLAETPFSTAEIGFSAVAADDVRAEHLGCMLGTPLFEADRSTWLDGAPVTFVRMTYAPGHRMAARY